EMAREGLRIDLAAALRQAATQNTEIVRDNVRVKTNGDYTLVNVSATTISDPETLRGLLLVTFSEPKPTTPSGKPAAKTRRTKSGDDDRIADLERELQLTKESLKTSVADLATSNEELKSTNEELQSTNEELQSTNEELETSKEELQSLNEELTTVNTELLSKVEDLSNANDDMQNLLNSTDIATVFLDNELNIKRFTEKATSLITLRSSDVGRPISELASHLQYDDLAGHCRSVLKTLALQETEVRTKDGSCFLMRVMPYRTAGNVIDGLVITFVDINRIKHAERVGAESTAYFHGIIDTLWEPLVVLDHEFHVVSANRSFYDLFQTSLKRIEGESLFKLGSGEWNIPEMRQRLERILPQEMTVEKFEVAKEFPQLGHRVFQINARRLERDGGLPAMILLAIHDATEKIK
ncbi:MAG: PAS domain-containing protein, partial [Planctomycetaceae bacterium]|nr:PAS domain-containing protein [Planctomycetaceae bacterium]